MGRSARIALTLVIGVALVAASCQRAPSPPRRPNIVVIYTDDLSTRLMKYLPDLKAMIASQGLEMRSISPAALCAPGRASFLTGKYAHNHGVFGNAGGAARFRANGNESRTFAVWAQDAGYTTGFFGKYINGYGGPSAHVPPGWNRWVSFRKGSLDRRQLSTVEDGGKDRTVKGSYDTDFLAEQATAFLETAPEPFLLVFAPLAPHGPFVPADRHRGAFANLAIELSPSFQGDRDEQIALTRTRLEMMLSVQEAMVSLFDALIARGAFDDTYVFFTSDNGTFMGEHGVPSGKGEPYDEATQVPLYVRGPGVPIGVRSTLVAEQDLAPTFAELMGAPIPSDVDGRSLVPLLHGSTDRTSRRRVLLHGISLRNWWRGTRTAKRMQVDRSDGPCEMYFLDRDPYQQQNLGCESDEAKQMSELARRLAKCVGSACAAVEDECGPHDGDCPAKLD